jgi:hypothetical protein
VKIQRAATALNSDQAAYSAFPVAALQEPIIVQRDDMPDSMPRLQVLKALFDDIVVDIPPSDHQSRVMAVARWVQHHFVHPVHTPLRPDGAAVYDPIQLLRLRRAQCGQVNRVLLDLLDAAGYRGRVVQLRAHQGAEVFYDGAWHYIEADALTGGQQILKPDGTLPSAMEIHANPQWLDGVCLGCEFKLMGGWLMPEIADRYTSRRDHYIRGGAWREVFSIPPEYYERVASADQRIGDPEYGWLVYVHERADGSRTSIGH